MRVEFYLGLIDLILTNLKRLIHFRLVRLVIFKIKRFFNFPGVAFIYIYELRDDTSRDQDQYYTVT